MSPTSSLRSYLENPISEAVQMQSVKNRASASGTPGTVWLWTRSEILGYRLRGGGGGGPDLRKMSLRSPTACLPGSARLTGFLVPRCLWWPCRDSSATDRVANEGMGHITPKSLTCLCSHAGVSRGPTMLRCPYRNQGRYTSL